MKLIKRFQPGGNFTNRTDNTSVARQQYYEPIKQVAHEGNRLVTINGKTYEVPIEPQYSVRSSAQDTRTEQQKKEDQKRLSEQHEQEKGEQNAEGFFNFVGRLTPSRFVKTVTAGNEDAVFDDLAQADNGGVFEGNEFGNLAFDVISPFVVAKGFQGAGTLYNLGKNHVRNALVARQFNNALATEARRFYSIGTPGWPYFYDPVTNQWDFSNANQLINSGKQEFIDWMNNPLYRQAAKANQAEAKSMGLAYTPTYEKAEYLRPQKTKIENLGSPKLGGSTDRNGDIAINLYTDDPKGVMAHEYGHANWHGNVSESTMASNLDQGKKEWQYLKYKSGQVFKPNSWYSDKFDLHSHGPEAVMNARDYGKEIGLKIGQEYPGYEKALELINNNKNGFKSGLRDMFYLDKEHMPYVWKALTGTQFAFPAVGISLSYSNN